MATVSGTQRQLTHTSNTYESNGSLTIGGNLNINGSGTVDGRDIAVDGVKLDGIATGANNYSLPAGTSSERGGFKIGYSEDGQNYPVEVSSEQMFVTVPWTDTNTTYSAGTHLSLGGTTFNLNLGVADAVLNIGHNSIANEGEIILDTSNAGSPQISFTEHEDASWAIGVDDIDNSFKIHGVATSVIPTINGLAAPLFNIGTNGKVGIGTASPTAQLESIAPDGNGSSLRLGRSDTSIIWDFNHAGGDLRIWNSAASGSDILLGVDSAGTVKNNNVGIGTASPSEKLHVNGIIRTHSSDVAKYINISGGGSNNYIDTYGNSLYIRYGGDVGRAILLNSAGNVGIGITSPSAKLHVNGPIAQKVYTASTLPSASPAGQRAFISDSAYGLATAIGAVVSGGGSNTIPVYSNGSSWRAG